MIAPTASMSPTVVTTGPEFGPDLGRLISAVSKHIVAGVALVQQPIQFLAVVHGRIGHGIMPDQLVLGVRVHMVYRGTPKPVKSLRQLCFSHIACFTELVSSLIAISFSSFDLPSKTLRMCEVLHLWAAKNMRALYATQQVRRPRELRRLILSGRMMSCGEN
jgi:hypothetical protein